MTDCRRATMFKGRNGAQLQRPGAPRGAAPDITDILDTRLSEGVATGEIDPVRLYTRIYVLKCARCIRCIQCSDSHSHGQMTWFTLNTWLLLAVTHRCGVFSALFRSFPLFPSQARSLVAQSRQPRVSDR